ncbi:MAG: biotin--[acetyl-CoA-carboxylase] ligase [Gemmatimonadota bacterium]|nr:biotin--[acetyl-CoA-carboxylase] ligase [Gemmatimonadota bacterium]
MSAARPADAAPDGSAPWAGRSAGEWMRRFSLGTAEFHARIGSTNDRARVLVREESPLPALVVADRQSAGRGRRGRRWASDTPLGLWCTVARDWPAGDLGPLSLRVGLAVARGIESEARGLRIEVKWPNDLLVSGRKLGGILCERAGGAVLVGIGINVNQQMRDLPLGLAPAGTSVLVESGRRVPRGRLLEAVMESLAQVWARTGRLIPREELAALQARSPLDGRRLSVDGAVRHSSGRPRTVQGLVATSTGMHPDGSLGLRDEGGRRLSLIAGSVSLKSTLKPGS